MDLQHKIEEIAAPFLQNIDAFVVDIQVIQNNQKKIVQLFIDTDTGITISQCSEISRQISAALELQNVITGPYVIEVSSPGLKKPLKLLRQYRKNVGRQFKVRFKKDDQIQEIIAKLMNIDETTLMFASEKNESYAIPFNEIIESIEELPW